MSPLIYRTLEISAEVNKKHTKSKKESEVKRKNEINVLGCRHLLKASKIHSTRNIKGIIYNTCLFQMAK